MCAMPEMNVHGLIDSFIHSLGYAPGGLSTSQCMKRQQHEKSQAYTVSAGNTFDSAAGVTVTQITESTNRPTAAYIRYIHAKIRGKAAYTSALRI